MCLHKGPIHRKLLYLLHIDTRTKEQQVAVIPSDRNVLEACASRHHVVLLEQPIDIMLPCCMEGFRDL